MKKEGRSEDEKKKTELAEETKKEVRQELSRLKEVKLTPRQEILKKYLLFLRFMAAIQHGKEDCTPPTRYKIAVSIVFPNLEKEFETINDTFCATLYGFQDVEVTHLRAFNSS